MALDGEVTEANQTTRDKNKIISFHFLFVRFSLISCKNFVSSSLFWITSVIDLSSSQFRSLIPFFVRNLLATAFSSPTVSLASISSY